MRQIINVRFEDSDKPTKYMVHQLLPFGTPVIVPTSNGLEYAKVLSSYEQKTHPGKKEHTLRYIIRVATKNDSQRLEEIHKKEQQAFPIVKSCILRYKLDIKLTKIHYTFDQSKMLIYFTSDGRIDFRNLVKELASIFHVRIEMRQIGVRDSTRQIGGLGSCGRPFCCTSFLSGFRPVSIKMAKEQGLALNPAKISGTCGRLMCCLKYEHSVYSELIKDSVKVGTMVKTPDGIGVVCERNLLMQVYQVRLSEQPDSPARSYSKDDLTVVKKNTSNPKRK